MADTVTGQIQEALDKDCSTGQCSQIEQDIQHLQQFRDIILELEHTDIPDSDSPDADKLALYRDYMDTYQRVVEHYSAGDDKSFQDAKNEVGLALGLPPTGLPELGSHYQELLAAEIRAMVEEADNNPDLSDEERLELYSDAYIALTENQYAELFEPNEMDMNVLSAQAGYLPQQILERMEPLYPSTGIEAGDDNTYDPEIDGQTAAEQGDIDPTNTDVPNKVDNPEAETLIQDVKNAVLGTGGMQ